MKGIRLANVIAVWKWWYKLIYMLGFSQYFLLNVHHLSDSIYIWNCCNQALCFKFKNNLEALAITIFAWIFLQIPIQKHNCSSMHSDNKNIWVDIPFYIIFPWPDSMVALSFTVSFGFFTIQQKNFAPDIVILKSV